MNPPGPAGPGLSRTAKVLLAIGIGTVIGLLGIGTAVAVAAAQDDTTTTRTAAPEVPVVASASPEVGGASPEADDGSPVVVVEETPEADDENSDDQGEGTNANPQPKSRLTLPKTLGGRPRIEDQTSKPGSETRSAVYGNAATQELTVFSGQEITEGSVQERLDALLDEIRSEFKATKITDHDPGPLAGLASCADGRFGDQRAGICVWADQDTIGLLLRTKQNGQATAKEFVRLRGQIETR